MTHAVSVRTLLPLVVLAALLAAPGCIRLGSKETPPRYYVLGGDRVDEAAGSGDGLVIGLRALRLASYLKTSFLVVRTGEHEVRHVASHRWSEDLDRGINRSVAGYLTATPTVRYVEVVPWPSPQAHDYVLQLQVLRFEGQAPTAAALASAEEGVTVDGTVRVHATWEVLGPGADIVLARGATTIDDVAWTVGDYPALVALLDEGLTAVTADVVAALETLAAP